MHQINSDNLNQNETKTRGMFLNKLCEVEKNVSLYSDYSHRSKGNSYFPQVGKTDALVNSPLIRVAGAAGSHAPGEECKQSRIICRKLQFSNAHYLLPHYHETHSNSSISSFNAIKSRSVFFWKPFISAKLNCLLILIMWMFFIKLVQQCRFYPPH